MIEEIAYLVVSLVGFWVLVSLLIKRLNLPDEEGQFPPACPRCWSITLTWLFTGLLLNLIPLHVTIFLAGMNAWDYGQRIQRTLTKKAIKKAQDADEIRMPPAVTYYRLLPLLAAIIGGIVIIVLMQLTTGSANTC